MARKGQKAFFRASAWRRKTKIRFSCFRVTRKDQNSFFHASARRGKAKIRFFVLPRGAERPKFIFSCFRVTRKDQNSFFRASARRRKAKIHFFMLPRGAERLKRRGERSSKADEPFSSLFKSIVSAYYQSCKRSLSGKYILSPFFTFHAL